MVYLTIIKNKGVASDEVHLTVSLHEVVSQWGDTDILAVNNTGLQK